jgi:hypothetical protein
MDPELARIRRYEVTVAQGDLLFVPTWTWHRVDYLPGITSLSTSFFHVKTNKLLWANPWYTVAVVPNMLKELIGLNAQ